MSRDPDRIITVAAVTLVLLWLAFWGGVIFVAIHFLAKVW